MSGVDIDIEDAYLLDRDAAVSHILELRKDIQVLETLLRNLAPCDVVKIGGNEYRRRRIVSKVIADTLGGSFPDQSLFMTWSRFKTNGIIRMLRTQGRDSPFGPALAGLSEAEMEQVASLGRSVMVVVDRPKRLPRSVRLPILAGICVAVRHWRVNDVIGLVRNVLEGLPVNLDELPENGLIGVRQIRDRGYPVASSDSSA